ncbi:MAG: hypothetical protein J0J10_00965 [Bosea sp.]|uniref:hypothetical protein n=1 Tax=Bosea sp. (in: a-proteobacteria) TaxID=1871050 RepID=UPI001AC64F47|nr:hypothetical protein [Bosea sp. (in: a-proteobacteria)]MBN9467317.1 hypothetical protein [Bosea sp. (in: a-proteobacteria)]
MGKIWVKEFTGGLDARRLEETTAGGVLILARDGHINRGGEFEQRAAFKKVYMLPAGATKGLAATADSLYVFGPSAAPAGMPSGVAYQQIAAPDSADLTKVLSATLFEGKLFVAARYADGDVFNFFNGAQVTALKAGTTPGVFALTVKQKVYVASGANLLFSAIANATDFDTGTGAGFIDMSTQARGSEQLTSLAAYQQYIAVFAGRTIQIEFVDPDPANNRQVQVLNNTGTLASRSVIQFGDNDVYYLDRSGIRSLRARQTINIAVSSDTGNPIDDLIIAKLKTLTEAERSNAISVIEPDDGRLWVALKDEIYVFSFFTGSKVSAWTTYSPGFNIDDMVEFDGRIYLRSGDDIYAYGGIGDTLEYDDSVEAEAWLPFLDANEPTQKKRFDGVDAACRGTWEIRASFDPQNGASDKAATIVNTTYGEDRIPIVGEATHIGLRFKAKGRAADGGPAVLGSVVIHHDMSDDED